MFVSSAIIPAGAILCGQQISDRALRLFIVQQAAARSLQTNRHRVQLGGCQPFHRPDADLGTDETDLELRTGQRMTRVTDGLGDADPTLGREFDGFHRHEPD
jgi:hypothetical protein